MKIIRKATELLRWRQNKTKTIGFVPTLGALHFGHLSLVASAKKNCTLTIVSIFLNPTQFAPNEDLDSYPNTIDKDIDALTELNVDILFLPTKEEMYDKVNDVQIPTSDLFNKLEGSARPHFFYGVTTIVAKLFNVIKPTHVFFGEKDAQQLRIIQQMIIKMQYPIQCMPCATVRDKNGLALSSRNQHLTIAQQNTASIIYRALMQLKSTLDKGEKNPEIAKNIFKNLIWLVPEMRIDYISISYSNTLNEVEKITNEKLLISSAVFFNDVRLIDNIVYLSSTT